MIAVSQADFAKMVGVSHQAVSQAIKNGRLPASGEHGQKGRRILLDAVSDKDVMPAAASLWENTSSFLPHHQARKSQFDEQRQVVSGKWQVASGHPPAEPSPASGRGQGEGSSNPPPPAAEPMPAMEKLGAALKLETYKLQKAKAETANMELDKLAGALVERAEVDFVLADFGNTLRGLLEGLPDRMAHECLRIRDAADLHKYLADTFADTLTEMAEHMKRKMDSDA